MRCYKGFSLLFNWTVTATVVTADTFVVVDIDIIVVLGVVAPIAAVRAAAIVAPFHKHFVGKMNPMVKKKDK